MTLERKAGGYLLRMRYGAGRRGEFLIATQDSARAHALEPRMLHMGKQFVDAPSVDGERARELLREAASMADNERRFAAVERVVTKVCTDAGAVAVTPAKPAEPRTFQDVARLWMTNTLHERHPDQIRKKAPRTDERYRSALLVLGRHIGRIDVKELALEDAERAMAALPPMAQGTRRIYAIIIRRVMSFAEWPLRLIERSPIPAKFVPKQGKPPAFAYLYPEEDAALIACPDVPFDNRVLYGVLDREGLRISEATALTWGDLDLRRGRITLDKNKTSAPRAWTLDPSVTETLRAYRGEAGDDDLVFANFVDSNVAKRFRAHLRQALEWAGLPARKELFARTAERRPIRIHDLRATFITLALAAGRSETWVMDRTGHTTSQMLGRYRRIARTASETERAWLLPLHVPQGVGGWVGTTHGSPQEMGATHSIRSTESAPPAPTSEPDLASDAAMVGAKVPGEATPTQGVGTGVPGERPPPGSLPAEPAPQAPSAPEDTAETIALRIEESLAYAMRVATDERRWDVVLELGRQLEARRLARVAPGVPSLADVRAKKKGDGK